jgi:N-acetylglucosaminyldiphosphoundecaprenol N-acetyl-beta-D-mannosaminyltransferase
MKTEPPLVVLLGLPFHDLSLDEIISECGEMMEGESPRYVVTANVDFTAQADEDVDLRKIVYFADRVVCDGMPLVWLSRIFGHPLKERVAGSDMVPRLLELCAREGHPVYFFGSDLETLKQAGEIAAQRYPGLRVAGCDAPAMGAVVEWDNESICRRMKESGAKLLLVCLGCPKQERWIFANHSETGIPLSIGVGASLDFITGKQVRAPLWMQKTGLEWFWRMAGNPKRLVARYSKDFLFIIKATFKQARLQSRRQRFKPGLSRVVPISAPDVIHLRWEGSLEKGRMEGAPLPDHVDRPVLLNGSGILFMDSGGLGRLVVLIRKCRAQGVDLFIVAPSDFMSEALASAQMASLVTIMASESEALKRVTACRLLSSSSAADDEGAVKVSFQHPLDAIHLDAMMEALDHAAGNANRLIIDLEQVDFIDSRAVGALIRVHKRMLAKAGDLLLWRPRPDVREILRLLRVDSILPEWKEIA